jgi:hypothetical protein
MKKDYTVAAIAFYLSVTAQGQQLCPSFPATGELVITE